jgi:HEAT repeat protein
MHENTRHARLLIAAVVFGFILLGTTTIAAVGATQNQAAKQALTPLQLEIEKQRLRLSSVEIEDRRDALVRLRALHHVGASRVALSALKDATAIVRATAAASVLALPPEESVPNLIPLLSDKEEFVRQQVAYALGQTRSNSAVAALIERLTDKKDSVRGAAAVALGEIADAAAVTSLATVLNSNAGLAQSNKNRSKPERNAFVLRAAAHSLGQIGNRAGLPALILVLEDVKAEDDLRREAAVALGSIGDAAALPALRGVLAARDPYLSQSAQESIKKISRAQQTMGIR